MKTLSYTQEFFLCAINSKGNIPVLSVNVQSGLFAGGLMELLSCGYITRIEKDKLVAGKTWDDGLPYLKPLYEMIVSLKKPKNVNGITDIYLLYSQKPFNELFAALGASLVEAECADELTKRGLLKKKIKYVPKKDAVKKIIEKVRAEFLEDGMPSDEAFCLAALLDRNGLIRDYFSKVEAETLKKRIKEVRKSEACALINEIIDYIESAAVVIAVVP